MMGILHMTHGKAARPRIVTTILVGCVLLGIGAACSSEERMGRDFDMPSAPSRAGTLDALVNTEWAVPGADARVSFLPGGALQLVPDLDPGRPMTGHYALEDNGLLNVNVSGSPFRGVATWDGKRIVLNGEELEPLGRTEATTVAPVPVPPPLSETPSG